jgi:hypothetical protein
MSIDKHRNFHVWLRGNDAIRAKRARNPLPNLANSTKEPARANRTFLSVGADPGPDLLPRPIFLNLLRLERSRAERSGRRIGLMLVESPSLLSAGDRTGAAEKIQYALSRSTRDTDIRGWYQDGAVIGVILTELPLAVTSISEMLSAKVNSALHDSLGAERAGDVALYFHVFPDHSESDQGEGAVVEAISAR